MRCAGHAAVGGRQQHGPASLWQRVCLQRTRPCRIVQQLSRLACCATSSSVMSRRGAAPPNPDRSAPLPRVSRTQSIWLCPISKGTRLRRAAGATRWCRDSGAAVDSVPPMAAAAQPFVASATLGALVPEALAASPLDVRSTTVAPASSGFCKGGEMAGLAAAGAGDAPAPGLPAHRPARAIVQR